MKIRLCVRLRDCVLIDRERLCIHKKIWLKNEFMTKER